MLRAKLLEVEKSSTSDEDAREKLAEWIGRGGPYYADAGIHAPSETLGPCAPKPLSEYRQQGFDMEAVARDCDTEEDATLGTLYRVPVGTPQRKRTRAAMVVASVDDVDLQTGLGSSSASSSAPRGQWI